MPPQDTPLEITGIAEVILYVEDMARQVAFYRQTLGLPIQHPQGLEDSSGERGVMFATPGGALCLHSGGQRRHGKDAPRVVFAVPDLEQAREALAALAAVGVPLGEVRAPAPGIRVCEGQAPEGYRFSLEASAHG